MDLKERNRRIVEAGSATRLRRKLQECKTFKFKVDRSSLTELQAEQQIKHWVNEKTSFKIHHSILGRLKSRLTRNDKVVVLNKWLPTTKYCSKCGTLNETLTLNDRIFVCTCCGNTEDRDIHAANNMIYFYLNGGKFNVNNT